MTAIGRNWPVLFAAAVAVIGTVIFASFLRWGGLSFSVQVAAIAGLLAPLAFASAVVERSVEILISPWRDANASKLEKQLATIQARPIDPANPTKHAADVQTASDELDDYRGSTQKYAFAVSLTVSILVSIAGVRAFGPFLDATKFDELLKAHPCQHLVFLCVDVVLSGALLAGGADGIHSIMNAITSFFNATADKAKA